MNDDPRNRFPRWGPLVRVWHLLSREEQVAFAPFVDLDLAHRFGFEPVIGGDKIAGLLLLSVRVVHALRKIRDLPVYDMGRERTRGRLGIVAPLCQLLRWTEVYGRPQWKRHEGW